MEDYMTLIRVYFQAAIAETAGITNLAVLPDLRVFKNTLKVPTMKNKRRMRGMMTQAIRADIRNDAMMNM